MRGAAAAANGSPGGIDPALEDELSCLPSFGSLVRIADAVSGGLSHFGWDVWHPEQQRFERQRTGWDFVLKSRQMGFSTVELARDLQYARLHEGAQVLIVTADRDEKAKFFARLQLMADGLLAAGLAPEPRYSTKTEIVWADTHSGVYITESGASEGAAEKTGRSGTVHRAHLTEAAFWGSPAETWASVDGALEHGDEAVVESTANGADTWFHARWRECVDGRFGRFKAHFFPWFEHPGREADVGIYPSGQTSRERRWEERLVDELGITERQLAWWRMKVSTIKLDKALREYPPTPEAAFQSEGGSWIDAEWLDELDAKVREPIRLLKLRRGTLRIYEEPIPGEPYVITGDVSEGGGNDEASIVVGHHRREEVVAAWDDTHTGPKDIGRLMAEVGTLYNKALAAPEIEGMRTRGREPIGLVTLRELKELSYPRIFEYVDERLDRREQSKSKRLGWPTNKATRGPLLEDLKDGIEDQSLWTPDRKMVAEARSMVRDQYEHVRARGKHSSGGDDGLFFAWAIFIQVCRRARPHRPGGHTIEGVGSLVSADFRT